MSARERPAEASGLARYLPVVAWLPAYRHGWLRGDVTAGVTTAAVVIPQAMAYATIAGLPVQAGLYVAVVPTLAYALLGSSRPLSVSSTSTLSALTAAAIATAAHGDPSRALVAASTLAALSGALLLLAGVLRLGFLADFISAPVLAGFKAGTGLLIAAGQLGKLLGIPQEGDSFFRKVGSALANLGQINWPTALLSAVSIAILLALRRWAPRSFPGPLVVVALGIFLAFVTGLAGRGVALVGTIPAGLPGFAAPDLSMVQALLPAAAGVALMSFVESIAAGRAFATRQEPHVDADQELRALGAANLAGGLFQAYPAGGGLSQTAVNRQAGARSQLAEMITAVVVVLTLLFLTPLFEKMPEATLGAVVIVAVIGLIQADPLRRILAIRARDFGLAMVALVGVLALGVLPGVLLAVLVSMLTLIYGANHPPIEVLGRKPGTGFWRSRDRHPDDETVPGLLVVRPVAGLYFANADRVRRRILELVDTVEPRPDVLLLDLDAVPDIDVTALELMIGFRGDLLERGIELWLANANARPLEMLRRSLDAAVLEPRLYRDVEAAATVFAGARP